MVSIRDGDGAIWDGAIQDGVYSRLCLFGMASFGQLSGYHTSLATFRN